MGISEVIVLDTHVWLWWNLDTGQLKEAQSQAIEDNEGDVIGISAVSCWEVAKLVASKRVELPLGITEWFDKALAYLGVSVLPLTPEIAVESTTLPGDFHSDPFDQIIVATARVHLCSLVTSDRKIIRYPHVTTVS